MRFASSGDPNGADLPQWEHYTASADPVLEFGATIAMRAGLRTAYLDFIERFFGRTAPTK
jgi:carboxylesterase type B